MDKVTPAKRSAIMRAIRSKNTNPEMVVRRLVHGLGYRFRLHRNDLPGRPDLIFPSRHKVIFVHGCFWHQHRSNSCRIARQPKSNQAYWLPKLGRTTLRDRTNEELLQTLGWSVLTVWECETKNPEVLSSQLAQFLG
ncbi:very short patch repair endonuclease [Aminobacter sp. Piv2-1]|uniref:very short patch repair endonuclease n=1 Tax=Aminobacter sp. Piv2-1 TaxID=3031122 RepID=UPI0030B73CE1